MAASYSSRCSLSFVFLSFFHHLTVFSFFNQCAGPSYFLMTPCSSPLVLVLPWYWPYYGLTLLFPVTRISLPLLHSLRLSLINLVVDFSFQLGLRLRVPSQSSPRDASKLPTAPPSRPPFKNTFLDVILVVFLLHFSLHVAWDSGHRLDSRVQ